MPEFDYSALERKVLADSELINDLMEMVYNLDRRVELLEKKEK
jgi:hypothetical protein